MSVSNFEAKLWQKYGRYWMCRSNYTSREEMHKLCLASCCYNSSSERYTNSDVSEMSIFHFLHCHGQNPQNQKNVNNSKD